MLNIITKSKVKNFLSLKNLKILVLNFFFQTLKNLTKNLKFRKKFIKVFLLNLKKEFLFLIFYLLIKI